MYNDHAGNLLSSSVIVQLYLRSPELVSLLWMQEGERRFVRSLQMAREGRREGKNDASRPRYHMVN